MSVNNISLGLAESRYVGVSSGYLPLTATQLNAAASPDVAINAASLSVYNAGGGTVVIPPGIWKLAAPLNCYNGVSFHGAGPILAPTGTLVPDAKWNFGANPPVPGSLTGTVLQGDGTFACFAAYNTDLGSPAVPLTGTGLTNAGWYNLGLDSFSYGFQIGGANQFGILNCEFRNIYIRQCSQWAMQLTNSLHGQLDTVYCVENYNSIMIRTALAFTQCAPGHVHFNNVFQHKPGWNATGTATNGNATIPLVAGQAQFLCNGYPVQVGATVGNLTAKATYYVINTDKVNDTIQLSATLGGAAIVPNAGGSLAIHPANLKSRHLVFQSDTVASSISNEYVGMGIKSQTNNNWYTVSQTATFTNTSTSVQVDDATQFAPHMPVHFTSTVAGFTITQQYIVKSIVDATHITLGNYYNATAIAATASTTGTIVSNGFPAIEICTEVSFQSVGGLDFRGIDIETSNGEVGIYAEYAGQCNFAIDSMSGTYNSAVCYRNCGPTITNNVYGGAYDIDGNSSTGCIYEGYLGTQIQRAAQGFGFDSTTSTFTARVGGNVNSGGGASTPDFQARQPGGNFIYPFSGMGERIFPRDTTANYSGVHCGTTIFNGGSGQTITFPTITTDATPQTSYVGIVYAVKNISANNLTLAVSSSQYFDNISGLGTITLPPGQSVKVVASKTLGGTFFWATYWTGGATIAPAQAKANLTAQSATVASVLAFTPNILGTFRVSAYATITAAVTDTLTLTVTYTDENSNSQTQTFYPNGTVTAAVGPATGAYSFGSVTIRAKAGSAITVVATVAGAGSITYDVGAFIDQIN